VRVVLKIHKPKSSVPASLINNESAMAASFLSIVSYLFGWIYFLCWSFSFYPQTILNWRRKSTSGTTIDFTAINLLGFSAYFVSNASFLFSSQIRREYALRNHGLTPTVQINDLAFAAHAVVITTVTWSQYAFPGAWGFDKRTKGEHGARMTSWIKGIIVGSFVGVAITALIVSARHDEDPENGWAWIDVVSHYKASSVRDNTDMITHRSMLLDTSKSSLRS
jgi:cystinosin